MKGSLLAASACLFAVTVGSASAAQSVPALMIAQTDAPVAGDIPLSVSVAEMEAVVHGWSAKKHLLGKTVKNDKNENLGTLGDLIITPKDLASYAILDVGGFLGMGERKVAIPMRKIEMRGNVLVLPNATKEVLKNMPPFVYAK